MNEHHQPFEEIKLINANGAELNRPGNPGD